MRAALSAGVSIAVLGALVTGTGVAAQARTEPGIPPLSASVDGPRAKVVAFRAKAPSSVRASQVFTVTGTLSGRFGGLPIVGEVQVGKKWVSVKAARVGRNGNVTVPMQLSKPGTHRIRLRVPGKQAAQSQVLTVKSTGKVATDESPLRMYSHWLSRQSAVAPRSGRVQPMADGATEATEAAAATSDQLAGFESLASGALDATGAAVVGFGVNTLLGLLFPGASAATGATGVKGLVSAS